MANNKNQKPDIDPAAHNLESRVDAVMGAPPISSSTPTLSDPQPVPMIVKPSNPLPRKLIITDRAKPQLIDSRPSMAAKALTPNTNDGSVPVRTERSMPSQNVSADVPEPQPARLVEPKLDDPTIDAAIDDIVAHESDELLAAEDAIASQSFIERSIDADPSWFMRLVKQKRFWLIGILILIAVCTLPAIRYPLLGLVDTRQVSVTVIDSKTETPVSGAVISNANHSATTAADGKATIKLPVGKHLITISKKFYKASNQSVFIGLRGDVAVKSVQLAATGRQVPLTVVNTITGKPVAGVIVSVHGTSTKTTAQGMATIVLPPDSKTLAATLSAKGYTATAVNLTITSETVTANNFTITPSGELYFLSDSSGTISVVKSGLDGSNRQTVLAGTGTEDLSSTKLLASPDWKYLALESQRNSAQPALYLISASNGDQLSEFDNSTAQFKLIGWIGDDLIYDEIEQSIPPSQMGHELIKSYNAQTGQLNQLDQNQVSGSGSSYAYQSFSNFQIINGMISYTTQWLSSGGASLSSLSDNIRGIGITGQNKKDYLSVAASGISTIQAAAYAPNSSYYAFTNTTTGSTSYYQFENSVVSENNSLSAATLNATYPTYYPSPANDKTFWKDSMAGARSLLIGDQNGQNSNQLKTSGNYDAFGWYGENYVLVSEGNDQLYIMSSSGTLTPYKVTSYSAGSTAYVSF